MDNQYEDANSELERNNFDGACILFRQASLIAEPNQGQLANLSVSEEGGILEFRRHLCRLYPDSFPCNVSLMRSYLSSRRPLQTVEISSRMLSQLEGDFNASISLRIIRFESAISAGLPDLVFDDFVWLWNAGANNRGASMLRKRILVLAARCSNHSLEATFKKISLFPSLDNCVSRFFSIKSEELNAVHSAIEQTRNLE